MQLVYPQANMALQLYTLIFWILVISWAVCFFENYRSSTPKNAFHPPTGACFEARPVLGKSRRVEVTVVARTRYGIPLVAVLPVL